jgi:hypothetical protein
VGFNLVAADLLLCGGSHNMKAESLAGFHFVKGERFYPKRSGERR